MEFWNYTTRMLWSEKKYLSCRAQTAANEKNTLGFETLNLTKTLIIFTIYHMSVFETKKITLAIFTKNNRFFGKGV